MGGFSPGEPGKISMSTEGEKERAERNLAGTTNNSKYTSDDTHKNFVGMSKITKITGKMHFLVFRETSSTLRWNPRIFSNVDS